MLDDDAAALPFQPTAGIDREPKRPQQINRRHAEVPLSGVQGEFRGLLFLLRIQMCRLLAHFPIDTVQQGLDFPRDLVRYLCPRDEYQRL